MKRSASAPSLNTLASTGKMKNVRSSACLQALAIPDIPPTIEVRQQSNLWTLFQLHSMLKAPSHVIDTCVLDVFGKPVSLDVVVDHKDRNLQSLAYCIATPPEHPELSNDEDIIGTRLRSRNREEEKQEL